MRFCLEPQGFEGKFIRADVLIGHALASAFEGPVPRTAMQMSEQASVHPELLQHRCEFRIETGGKQRRIMHRHDDPVLRRLDLFRHGKRGPKPSQFTPVDDFVRLPERILTRQDPSPCSAQNGFAIDPEAVVLERPDA